MGFTLALLPLPGINIPIGVILAKLLKLNIPATTLPALLLTYLSPVLYLLNYKTGAIFISSGEKPPQDFAYDLTFLDKIVDFFTHAGPAYLLGSIINAILAGTLSYLIFLLIYNKAHKLSGGGKIRLARAKKLQGFHTYVYRLKKRKTLKNIKPK